VRRSRAAEPVVDGGTKSVFGHGSDGNARLAGLVGGMKQFEQSSCGFHEVAGWAQARRAADLAEADQELIRLRFGGIEAQRLRRCVMARQLAGRLDARTFRFDGVFDLDWPGTK
jgi:hypothetical protein